MRMSRSAVFAALCLLALPGCIARTVASVVTAPVRVAGKAVDMATTSQSEADEKRGRDLRLREQRLRELERSHQKHSRQCAQGNAAACARADNEFAEIERIRPQPGAGGR